MLSFACSYLLIQMKCFFQDCVNKQQFGSALQHDTIAQHFAVLLLISEQTPGLWFNHQL